MTTLCARFIIKRDIWKSSNQRLNPIMAGIRSSRIEEYSESIWKQAVFGQFGIAPIEPDRQAIVGRLSPDVGDDGNDDAIDLLQTRLDELIEMRSMCRDRQSMEYRNIADSIKRQRHSIALRRADIRKRTAREKRIFDRNVNKELIRQRLELNKKQRIFNAPVIFYTRTHNISEHRFDYGNSYPTIKPIQDAATNIGVVWADDNSGIIPYTINSNGGMLGHDYVIDVIIRSVDDEMILDPFSLYSSYFR